MNKLFEMNQCILNQIPEVVLDYRRQRFFDASSKMTELIRKIDALITGLQEYNLVDYINQLIQILPIMINAQEANDYLFVSDILEDDLKTLLQNLQLLLQSEIKDEMNVFKKNMKALEKKNKALYDKFAEIRLGEQFVLCRAINGQLNCKYEAGHNSLYMHSTINPYWAAKEMIDGIWEEDYDKYFVWGFGVGYHVKALLEKADFYQVQVLESNIDMIAVALQALDFSEEIESNRLIICWDESEMKLLQSITAEENDYVFIYYPSLKLVMDETVRDVLEEFFVKANTIYEHGTGLISNFKKLQKMNLPSCEELNEVIKGKKVVIVAGGPSVDEEIENIKKYRNQITVFAVGRIARRLKSEGVKPDLVIVIDSGQEIMSQFEGIDYDDVPLIMLSTAYYEVQKIYKGPVYLAYQKGYPKAEKVANERGYMLVETGGSVTTTATDIAIKLGAKSITFVGLDLAYTNGNSHATGANEKKMSYDDSELRQVVGINGNKICTVKTLDCYRKWIERRIAKENGLKFYNTGSGARIRGTIEGDLRRTLEIK